MRFARNIKETCPPLASRSLSSEVLLTGSSRRLSIQGACPGGPCLVDLRRATRGFCVTGGAALSLSDLVVANGLSNQGSAAFAQGERHAVTQ